MSERRDRVIEAMEDGAIYEFRLRDLVDDFKREVVMATMAKAESMREASLMLGVTPKTLYDIRKEEGMEVRRYKRA